MIELLWFLIIGIVAGWLADRIMGGRSFGLLGDLIVGVIGAIIGGYLFSFLGISAGGLIGQLLMALIGAIILLFIISLINQPAARAR